MTDRRKRKGPTVGPGWMPIFVPLALVFVFSLILAFQAYDAGKQHRLTARASVREQAQFAAYLIATEVEQGMRESLLYGFYPIDLALGREVGVPPPGALLAEPEISRCDVDIARGERRFFRFSPGTGEVALAGPADPEFETWVAATVGSGHDDDLPFRHAVADVGGRRVAVAYRRWTDGDRDVVYGFETCWRTRRGNVFEAAANETQAFPPTLVGDTPHDSLFSLTARIGGRDLIHGEVWSGPASGSYGPESFHGTMELAPSGAYDGLELRVTLLPAVAERLVAGGVPPSRLPLALGLLGLTGLLMGVAVVQLRRSHELVNLRAGFVRNVSHELRTPLQQILLFTELLKSGRLEGESKRREALDIMHAETRRLIELVRNVLRFSNDDATAVHPMDIDLGSVVEETAEAFRPLASGRRATIKVTVERPATVHADPDGLKRVLINLLDNAVKYGPEGQTVRVDVRRTAEWGEVAVSDSGPGIAPEDRARIWEAFGRLEREANGPTGGSGIGLSLVRRIVDAMGGRVEVGDASPEGACFTVRLPLEAAAA